MTRPCARCVLTEDFPGVRLDEAGLCQHCAAVPVGASIADERARMESELHSTIERLRGTGPYDCIVAFSGGKDSSFTLKLLVERYGVRCLAVMVDNGFVSGRALENGRAVSEALGVDLVTYRPAPTFMRTMYRRSAIGPELHAPAAAIRASSICSSCIGLINSYVVRMSVEQGIPMVAAGYLAGQIPKRSSVVTIDVGAQARLRAKSIGTYSRAFGPDAAAYFALPDVLPGERTLTLLCPMLTTSASEEEIIREIEPLGWVLPSDTGRNSTNCRLNDLGIVVHLRRHGIHPYAFEIAEQVRYGLMNREEGMAKLRSVPEATDVSQQARAIGIPIGEL